MTDQELKKARKSGSSDILSLKNIKRGREYNVRELRNPIFSDNKYLVISEHSNETSIKKSSGTSILKFPKKSNSIITNEGIEEFRTTDGRLIMRQKVIKARQEATSNVLSLTGFIEAGKHYLITDLGPAIHVKEFVSSVDEIEAELQEAERQMHIEIEAEIEARERNNITMKK
jgi:hypothetical protein